MKTAQTTAHTPGPWILETTDNGLDGKIEVLDSATEGTVVATLRCRSVRMGIKMNDRSEEFTANARLIAAAPELLAALQKAVEQLSQCQEFIAEKGWSMAANHLDLSLRPSRAAIAKATGAV